MVEKVFDALTGRSRDGEDFDAQRLAVGPDLIDGVFLPGLLRLLDQVALVGGDDLFAGGQVDLIAGQLPVDGHDVLDGIAALGARGIHDVDQDPGALQVGQEFMAQASAVRRALNEAGDVRHDKARRVLQVHDAQDGLQGREVIVGDAGSGIAGHGQEGRFAHVGEADQAHVRDHLELQEELQGAGGLSRLGILGGLHGRGRVVHVAVAAAPAPQEHVAPHVTGHIHDDLARIRLPDDSALRDLDHHVLALFARHSLLFAVLTVLGGILAHVAEIGQCIESLVDDKDDISALAAVPSVGAACGDIFFTAEGDMSVAALAAGNNDSRFICKHRCVFSGDKNTQRAPGRVTGSSAWSSQNYRSQIRTGSELSRIRIKEL